MPAPRNWTLKGFPRGETSSGNDVVDDNAVNILDSFCCKCRPRWRLGSGKVFNLTRLGQHCRQGSMPRPNLTFGAVQLLKMEQIVTKPCNFLSSFPHQQQIYKIAINVASASLNLSISSTCVCQVVTSLHSLTTGGWTDNHNDSFQRQRKTFPGALPTPPPPPPSSVTCTDNTRATRAWPAGCRKGIDGRLSKNTTF